MGVQSALLTISHDTAQTLVPNILCAALVHVLAISLVHVLAISITN